MGYLLHDLLTESAARSPDKEALHLEGQSLTYQELETLTNQLARALRSVGVHRGDRVGIYLHKSLATVVAAFGAIKAGAIYVPLDASAPAKRLAYITRDCEIKLLVTSGNVNGLADLLREPTPVQTVVLTDTRQAAGLPSTVATFAWIDVTQQSVEPAVASGTIDTDLAYILYTSGSTGEPKGVMVAHRTIRSFIDWCCETFGMAQSDRVTSHAPLHFDLSTFDIYATLKAGGTVVLIPEKLSVFPVQLSALLQYERITVTYLVPSILSMMVTYGKLDAHDLSALRAILFAGEVFPIKYLRQLAAAIPQADYYNLYGPTETNVCMYHKVHASDLAPDRTQPVPIGVACQNTEVFAVDPDRQQVITEPNVEGELWVRGSCVAQGYWGDPQKTASAFVPNVFQPHFREIAYRTGDIVMLAEDRVNWIYVGRRDHMVKSRGYRIELGEIEAALYGHGQVREAAVVTIPDDLIGNRIKAFVVVSTEDLSRDDLEAHCSQVLPRYMLPDTIEFCKELPKTSTGKINRLLLAQS